MAVILYKTFTLMEYCPFEGVLIPLLGFIKVPMENFIYEIFATFCRAAVGVRSHVLPLVYFLFFSFVGDYIQTSADDVPWMMSSSANYRPFLSSFRHIPPQESFVKLAN